MAAELLCGGDPEFIRMCLPHITRKRDDPWWNSVLMTQAARGFEARFGSRSRCRYTLREALYDAASPGDAGGGERASRPREEHRIRATMLLDAGASLTIRDSLLKSTPLGWACRWGKIELVRLYLERGADPWRRMPNRGQRLWHGLRSAGITRLSSCSARMAQATEAKASLDRLAWPSTP